MAARRASSPSTGAVNSQVGQSRLTTATNPSCGRLLIARSLARCDAFSMNWRQCGRKIALGSARFEFRSGSEAGGPLHRMGGLFAPIALLPGAEESTWDNAEGYGCGNEWL